MDYYRESLRMHEEHRGKMATVPKVSVKNRDDLSTAYTPGVAEPCRRIKDDPDDIYRYTNKGNSVAVVTDGSAVLGLGNIGAEASLPVMDGKSLLFKEFAGIDATPLCIGTQDVDEIVNIVKNVSCVYGGINLEDISAPRCFEIEKRLQEELDIPVFHDDQHGTAVVVSAAVINGLRLTGRKPEETKVAINGAGAAGTAIAGMLMNLGIRDILVCDRRGILSEKNGGMNDAKLELARLTNPSGVTGKLSDAVKGRDLFVGVSTANVLTQDMIKTMGKDPLIFAMANPEPEINPELAKEAGAGVVGTGRSDYPNQINNVLIFPGLFRGALDARAECITKEMKVAAAYALAGLIPSEELSETNIISSPLNKDAAGAVARAVAEAWRNRQDI